MAVEKKAEGAEKKIGIKQNIENHLCQDIQR